MYKNDENGTCAFYNLVNLTVRVGMKIVNYKEFWNLNEAKQFIDSLIK